MKLRNVMVGLALALATGCDTMEKDVDAQVSINNEPVYVLKDGGFIDLPSRVIAPGKVTVEVTTSASKGELKDIGKGLLQYTPFEGSTTDFFRFRVFNEANKVLGEDSIGIIIPPDTTHLPCKYVYARNDSASGVRGPVTIDVAANDYSCSSSLTITIDVPPLLGTASVVGNKIHYVPAPGFAGTDYLLYKATSGDPTAIPGYAFLRIYGTNSGCTPIAVNDLFYKSVNDTSAIWLNVLANDTLCDSIPNVVIGQNPHYGYAWYDATVKKIGYRNFPTSNHDDTLRYNVCNATCTNALVVIKRN